MDEKLELVINTLRAMTRDNDAMAQRQVSNSCKRRDSQAWRGNGRTRSFKSSS